MIYIKSCASIIPGFQKGAKFGKLVDTQEILEQIRCESDVLFDTSFVKNRIGIKSVARTQTALDLIEKSKNDQRKSKKAYSLVHENPTIKEMLVEAMNLCAPGHEKSCVIAHIHVTGTAMVNHGQVLAEARKSAEIADGKYIPTFFLIKGCSGIYDAILSAESLLARSRHPINILITADSNMVPFVGQVTRSIAKQQNINEWLYPVIFAEGVGAMIVSNEPSKHSTSLRLDFNKADVVTEENRVHITEIENEVSCYIEAKGVRTTYLKGMGRNIERTLEYGQSFSNLDSVLCHESNPNLLDIIIKKYGIPSELVPKFSDQIGTLGPVSSFQLLETAFHKRSTKNKVCLNVVGELFSGVASGCLGFEKI